MSRCVPAPALRVGPPRPQSSQAFGSSGGLAGALVGLPTPTQGAGQVRAGVVSWGNHLEERVLDQAQARASYTPPFWGLFA